MEGKRRVASFVYTLFIPDKIKKPANQVINRQYL